MLSPVPPREHPCTASLSRETLNWLPEFTRRFQCIAAKNYKLLHVTSEFFYHFLVTRDSGIMTSIFYSLKERFYQEIDGTLTKFNQ